MSSREWFERHQPFLLALANTRHGRRLLCVENDVPRDKWVVELHPNAIVWANDPLRTYLRKCRLGEPVALTADVRVHEKFAKRLALDFLPRRRAIWASVVGAWRRYFGVTPAWADVTYTGYPDPNPETTTVDGYVRQSYALGSGVAWATIVGAAGSSSDDTSAFTTPIYLVGDNVSNQWQDLRRSIYLFDTSAVPPDSVILSSPAAVFSIYGKTAFDFLSATPNINVYSSAPASNTSLAAGDFDSLGSTAFSTAIAYASFSTTGYNDFSLNASGIAGITLGGITKFGCRNVNYDVAASAPPWVTEASSGFTSYFADQAGTANDPKLVFTYVRPRTYLAMMGVG